MRVVGWPVGLHVLARRAAGATALLWVTCSPIQAPFESRESPTVIVPQLRPSEPEFLGWVHDDLVVGIGNGRAHFWEPSTGRVLSVDRLSDWMRARGPVTSSVGIAYRGSRWRAATGAWDRVAGWGRGAVIASTLDRVARIASDGRLEVFDGPGAPVVLGYHQRGDLAFSPDGSRVLVCGTAVGLYDVASRERVAVWDRGANDCNWSEGPIAVSTDRGIRLLDPQTLGELGAPIEGEHAWVSGDGRRLALVHLGEREGVSVLDVATRRELLFRAMAHPLRARVVDDALAYEAEGGGGVLALDGTELLPMTPGFSVHQLGSQGRMLVVRDDAIDVIGGAEIVARWADPLLAPLYPVAGRLVGRARDARFELDLTPLGLRQLRSCARVVVPDDRPANYPRIGSAWLRRGGTSAHVARGCIARSDGTVLVSGVDPVLGSERGDRFVSSWVESLEVRDLDGARISELALENGDYGQCRANCEIRISPDGRWVVAARRSTVSVYEAATGRRVGRRLLGRVDQLLFLDDEVIGVVGRDGFRSLLDLPELALRAEWRGPRVGPHHAMPLHRMPGAVVDVDGTRITRWSLDGEAFVQRPSSAVRAFAVGDTLVMEEDGDLRALDAALSDRGLIPGTPAVSPSEAPSDEVLTCERGHLVRTTFPEGEPASRPLVGIPCDEDRVFAIRDGWLVVSGERPILLRPDDRTAELLVAMRGTTPHVALVADGELYGDDIRVMMRRTGFTSEGMVPVAPRGTVAAWLDAGRAVEDAR